MLHCPEYWELVQFVLQNCEKLHSFRGLYDKKKTAPHSTFYLRCDV